MGLTLRSVELNPQSGIPLYIQLKDWMEEQIHAGVFLPGTQAPSENELVQHIGVSRATVRQAYQKLVDSGALIKIRGRGTFVSQNGGAPLSKYGQASRLLAFLMRDAAGGVQPGLIKSVTSMATKFGYSTIVNNSGSSLECALESINHFADQHADGVLFRPLAMNPFDEVNYRICEEIQKRNLPFVFVDIPVKDVRASVVRSDNLSGGDWIGRYLQHKGHRDVLVVTHCTNTNTDDRIAGLGKQGHLSVEILLYYQEIEGDFERKLLRRFQSASQPTAIFAIHDLVARRLLDFFRANQIRVPQDISVVGFDDLEFSALLTPPLTTVHQDLEKMGNEAVRELLRVIQNPSHKARDILIPVTFVERESVRDLVPAIQSAEFAGKGGQ
jgi:GntR family transcriptional regulator of arabinose operon